MKAEIYVILLDGEPYRRNGAARTHQTRKGALREAAIVVKRWGYIGAKKVEVARLGIVETTEVVAE